MTNLQAKQLATGDAVLLWIDHEWKPATVDSVTIKADFVFVSVNRQGETVQALPRRLKAATSS